MLDEQALRIGSSEQLGGSISFTASGTKWLGPPAVRAVAS